MPGEQKRIPFPEWKNGMKKSKHYGRKNQSIISNTYKVFHWYDKNLKSFTISRLFDYQKSAIHPFHKIIPQNDEVQKEI